jgi:GDPmannose 4,6-dehydratase
MQWMMLQQDKPEDFVIATGVQYSVREFINKTAAALGMKLEWSGHGVEEVATWVDGIEGQRRVIVKIDTRYYRPTEVETLLGDPTKAKEKLGWVPELTLDEMIAEMVASDLAAAKQQVLLKSHGYAVAVSAE